MFYLPCIRFFVVLLTLSVLAALAPGQQPAARAADDAPAPPVLLMELYTSQGCYSCPPADDLLRTEYAARADILPLEFHVHYWDDLVYGFAGSWKDPFSSPQYTARQQAYNRKIRDTRSVYTPQTIVGGQFEAAGSRQQRIEDAIHKARAAASERAAPRLFFDGNSDAGWTARLDGTLQGNEELFYAIYLRERVTQVQAGENKDKTMTNTNIVRLLQRQPARRRSLTIPAYNAADEGCAVWVQKPQTGAIIAAARCPDGEEA